MIRNFFVAIFSVVYLVISSGFTFDLHYCMGKSTGWSLVSINNDKCDHCGMQKSKSKGCCKEESKIIKFTFDQKITDNAVLKIQQPLHGECLSTVDETSSSLTQPIRGKLTNLSPPHWRSIPVFIYTCNFRI